MYFFPSVSTEQNINIAFQLLAGPKWGPDTDWASDGKKAERRDRDHSCSIWGAKQEKKNHNHFSVQQHCQSHLLWITIITAYSMNLSLSVVYKLHAKSTCISAENKYAALLSLFYEKTFHKRIVSSIEYIYSNLHSLEHNLRELIMVWCHLIA